jgi:DNA replication and repair protein RecF
MANSVRQAVGLPVALLRLCDCALAMYLKTLHLRHFRNYADQAIAFDAPKTILVGDNAQGKSNVLEAIELLATLRSHRTARDGDLVQTDHELGSLRAEIQGAVGRADLALTVRRVGRRTVRLNGETLRRHLDALGLLNAVQFSCLDLDLVRGGPAQRRDWLDGLLVQLEPIYAHLLQQYNRILRQRNALLRSRLRRDSHPAPVPADLQDLALWDAQLAVAGTRVIRRRSRAIARLAPLAQHWQAAIGGGQEVLTVRYAPNVAVDPEPVPASGEVPDHAQAGHAQAGEADPHDDRTQAAIAQRILLDAIQAKHEIEQYQGTTLAGPHRDEVELLVDGVPARQYGSQGQQRTLVLALKLAELTLIESVVGAPPLLLLDDVLAELDLHRQNQLLSVIQDRFQTLVTTTHLGAFDDRWLGSARILTVRSGQIQDATPG